MLNEKCKLWEEFRQAAIKKDFKLMSEIYAELACLGNVNENFNIRSYFSDVSTENTIVLPPEIKAYLDKGGAEHLYVLSKTMSEGSIDIFAGVYSDELRDTLLDDDNNVDVKPFTVKPIILLDNLTLDTLRLSAGDILKFALIGDGIYITKLCFSTPDIVCRLSK